MTIRVRPREDSHTKCPYCHDTVNRGPKCSACGAVYHPECATLFGKCATRGCAGEFQGILELVAAFPRLALVARRIRRLAPDVENTSDRWVVVLNPVPRANQNKTTAMVLGEVLGQSAYDGRIRMSANYPDTLVRVTGAQRLEGVLARLRGAGLSCLALPLLDYVRPLTSFDVTRVVSLDPPVFQNREGEQRRLEPGAWLAIPAQLLEVEGAAATGRLMQTQFRGKGRSTKRPKPAPADKRHRQFALYLFERDNPDPYVLRERALQGYQILGDRMTASATQNIRLVAEQLTHVGGAWREMAKTVVTNQTLLISTDALGKKRSNETSVGLVARLMYHAWMAETS